MMTRKHNAAVKAQQKAERDKLRGQMRCVRLPGCCRCCCSGCVLLLLLLLLLRMGAALLLPRMCTALLLGMGGGRLQEQHAA